MNKAWVRGIGFALMSLSMVATGVTVYAMALWDFELIYRHESTFWTWHLMLFACGFLLAGPFAGSMREAAPAYAKARK